MRDHNNMRNIFSLNDEGALIICTWPEGTYHPKVPLAYSSENQGGYEYAAAIQMIQSGLVSEGMEIVEAIRDRYDGIKRNPWNEFECGSNYARNMVSYSLLNAFSGFQFDMPRQYIGFDPVGQADDFRCFFCLEPGWGTVQYTGTTFILSMIHGKLILRRLKSGMPFAGSVELNGVKVPFQLEEGVIVFDSPVTMTDGEDLRVFSGG